MNATPITSTHARIAWVVAFAVTAIFGVGLMPWETIEHLLDNGGVGDEGTSLLGFVAGYTLPATVGTAIVAHLALTNAFAGKSEPGTAVVIALIYAGSAVLSAVLGLFRIPGAAEILLVQGPIYVSLPANTFLVYLNQYGFGLLLSAVAIGSATALQLRAWSTAHADTVAG